MDVVDLHDGGRFARRYDDGVVFGKVFYGIEMNPVPFACLPEKGACWRYGVGVGVFVVGHEFREVYQLGNLLGFQIYFNHHVFNRFFTCFFH